MSMDTSKYTVIRGEALLKAKGKERTCKHPSTRLFAWVAYDGVLCAGCCECGAVLRGEAERK